MYEQSKQYTNASGTEIWYLPSKGRNYWHRIDGPAAEFANGAKQWRVYDELHRSDGPAAEFANGTKVWFVNGKRHRIDGPAFVDKNGTKEWYVNGKHMTEEVEQWIKDFNIDMDTDEGKMRFKLVWG